MRGAIIENSKNVVRRILPNSLIQMAFNPIREIYLNSLYMRSDFQFIHINKCGGTSVERALGLPFLNHDTAIQRRTRIGHEKWDKSFTFTVCRNPFDRMESVFFYQNRHREITAENVKDEFRTFLQLILDKKYPTEKQRTYETQAYWIQSEYNNNILIDAAFPLETINETWPKISNDIPKTRPLERLKRRSQKAKERAVYREDTIEIVQKFCKHDFKLFGYSASFEDSYMPAQPRIDF